jgi:hypothetical protein
LFVARAEHALPFDSVRSNAQLGTHGLLMTILPTGCNT